MRTERNPTPPLTTTAISHRCDLLAVHTPVHSTSLTNKKRIVVKCYDAKANPGLLKFTLTADVTPPPTTTPVPPNELTVPLLPSRLMFCGNDGYLIAAVPFPSSHVMIVWDIQRGTHSHTISTLPSTTYRSFTTSSSRSVLYLLQEHDETRKLLVTVYDLSKSRVKPTHKIKLGTVGPHDHGGIGGVTGEEGSGVFRLAVHEETRRIAVRHGNRGRIAFLEKTTTTTTEHESEKPVKFKLKKAGESTGHTMEGDEMLFAPNGKTLFLLRSDAVLLYSVHDGTIQSTAPLPSLPPNDGDTTLNGERYIHLRPDTPSPTNTTVVVAVTEPRFGRAVLWRMDTSATIRKLPLFATVTLPPPSSSSSSSLEDQRVLHRVCLPLDQRGSNELLLVETVPRGTTGDVRVVLSKVPYRSNTASNTNVSMDNDDEERKGQRIETRGDNPNEEEDLLPLLRGELYPEEKPSMETNDHTGSERDSHRSNKRKTNVVLGPGEGGNEAMNVVQSTDVLADQRGSKRSRTNGSTTTNTNAGTTNNPTEDEFHFGDDSDDPDNEADDGTTVAERLALLSSQLDADSDDDDDEEKGKPNPSSSSDGTPSSRMIPTPVTSDSLLTLLKQALVSNDDTQLETALQTTDRVVVRNSVEGLRAESLRMRNDDEEEMGEGEGGREQPDLVVVLLSKLTTRLSRKAGRAENLGVWVSAALLALASTEDDCDDVDEEEDRGGDDYNEGRRRRKRRKTIATRKEIATRLGPLRNMLNERVESLPGLLRLEGRLGLLGKLG